MCLQTRPVILWMKDMKSNICNRWITMAMRSWFLSRKELRIARNVSFTEFRWDSRYVVHYILNEHRIHHKKKSIKSECNFGKPKLPLIKTLIVSRCSIVQTKSSNFEAFSQYEISTELAVASSILNGRKVAEERFQWWISLFSIIQNAIVSYHLM